MIIAQTLLKELMSLKTFAEFPDKKRDFEKRYKKSIGEAKPLPQIMDYYQYQALFLATLFVNITANSFEYYRGYQSFFKRLNLVKTTELSDNEKLHLIKALTPCTTTLSSVSLNKESHLFLDKALEIKRDFGMSAFYKLFSLKTASVQRTSLLIYIDCMTLWLNIPDCLPSGDGVHAIQKELMQYSEKHKKPVGGEKSIAETMTSFAQKTELVQYPLDMSEIELIAQEYRQIQAAIESLKTADVKDYLKSYKSSNHAHRLKAIGAICLLIQDYFHIMPNSTQLFAILAFLHGDTGRFAQIKTGEGKSTLTIILAILLVLEGKVAHIFSSAKQLAIHAYKKNKEMLESLGISTALCTHERKTKYTEQIIYGIYTDFEFLVLYDAFKKKADQQLPFENVVAIIDEADNLLLDAALTGARIAIPHPNCHSWLLLFIFDWAKKQGKAFEVTDDVVQSVRLELSLFEGGIYKEKLLTIDDKVLRDRLINANVILYEYQLDVEYTLNKDKTKVWIVEHALTGEIHPTVRWSKGKHEFAEMNNDILPKLEQLTLAIIHNPSFFSEYLQIFAMSGTLGSLDERMELQTIHGRTHFDVPPHKPSLRLLKEPHISSTPLLHYQALKDEIMAIQSQGNRPILILCDSILSAKALFDYLVKYFFNDCQLVNEKQQADKEYIIRIMGYLKKITCATLIFARGIDAQLMIEALIAGGLHVIFSFFPANIRVEEQGFGRAARQGQPGSFSMNLFWEDRFIKKLLPKEFKKECYATAQEAIAYLNTLREAHVKIESASRIADSIKNKDNYHKFKIFSREFQYFSEQFDEFPFEKLNQSCKLLKVITVSREIPLLFDVLVQSAQQLLTQQKDGFSVNWVPFFHMVHASLKEYFKTEWGLFLEKLEDNPKEDFDGWMKKIIHPYVMDPLQGFIQLLTAILQVKSDAIKVALVIVKKEIQSLNIDMPTLIDPGKNILSHHAQEDIAPAKVFSELPKEETIVDESFFMADFFVEDNNSNVVILNEPEQVSSELVAMQAEIADLKATIAQLTAKNEVHEETDDEDGEEDRLKESTVTFFSHAAAKDCWIKPREFAHQPGKRAFMYTLFEKGQRATFCRYLEKEQYKISQYKINGDTMIVAQLATVNL